MNNLSTTLETSNPRINVIDNSGFFGYLGIDSLKENTTDPYVVSATSSTPHGHIVSFDLIATADGGFVDTLTVNLCVGLSVPSDTGLYYAYYSGGIHSQSPVFEWIAIDSTQSANPGTSLDLLDNQTVTVGLPFTFTYYGQNYTQISICSNGWIAMGSQTDVDWSNTGIPNSDGPSAMVAGLWDDLDPGNIDAPSDIYYYYDAANHRFIVEYFQVEHWPSGDHETFEVIFYDPAYYSTPTGDGEIMMQYLVSMQQPNATIGIENEIEGVGIQYYFDGDYDELAAPVTSEFAIRYTTIPPDYIPGVEEDGYMAPVAKNQLMIYPNITKGQMNIYYTITNPQSHAAIKMYDATGRLVKQVNHLMPYTSTHAQSSGVIQRFNHVTLDASHLPAGIYFVHIETENHTITKKVILID